MSMHLLGPHMTTTKYNSKKSKRKKTAKLIKAEAEAFDQLCLDVTARYTAACAKFTYHSCPAAWSGFCTAYSELMAIMWIHCKFAPSICSRTACVAIQRAAVAQMSAVFETCDCRSLAELLEDQIVYSCQ